MRAWGCCVLTHLLHKVLLGHLRAVVALPLSVLVYLIWLQSRERATIPRVNHPIPFESDAKSLRVMPPSFCWRAQ